MGKSARKVKRRGGKTVDLDAYYGRFLERGWIPRGPGQQIRGGRRRAALERRRLLAAGAQRVKKPYIAPAFRIVKDQALKAFYAKAGAAVAKVSAEKTPK